MNKPQDRDPEPSLEFAPNELVVDIGDRDIVEATLIDHVGWRAYPRNREDSPALGLVRLAGIEVPAGYLDETRTKYRDELSRFEPDPKRHPLDPLDILLFRLRREFAASFGGWTPLMGKNRLTDGVFGNPQHKSDRDPRPVAAGPPTRAQGVGNGVRVGVIDTPLISHADLPDSRVVANEIVVPGNDAVQPWAGHSTFVAGLIHSLVPQAVVEVRSVLDSETGFATSWDTAKKIASFAGSGIDVLNLSLGCRTADGAPPLVLTRAIERLGPTVLVVASAGNHGEQPHAKVPVWPAALPDVVAVGAVNDSGHTAAFSPKLPWVDCTAVGVDVASTYVQAIVKTSEGEKAFDGYAMWNGTSFSAAIVTGGVAARTVPGKVAAREAFQRLLDDPFPLVQKYDYWRDVR